MDPQTSELAIKLAAPFATIMAAIVAVCATVTFGVIQFRLGRRQADIAQNKLALDLFQRRIEAFSTTRKAVGQIATLGASSPSIEMTLIEAIDASRFLFGPDLRKYLDGLYHHLIKLDYCNKALNDPNLSAADRGKTADSRSEHFLAITDFYKQMDGLFGPYLSAEHVRFVKWGR